MAVGRLERRPLMLVLRALGMGDLLTGVPALRALAAAFPEHRRVLAAPATLGPLAELIRDPRGAPVVHELLATQPLQPLRARAPHVAVNLHGRGPHSHRLLLALRPRRLISFAHAEVPSSHAGPTWRAGEHEVRRWSRLLRESGVPCDGEALDIARPRLRDERLAGATLLHPGAASAARRWPLERWAGVARAERSAGRRVLVSGGRDEVPLASELARKAGLDGEDVIAGRTDTRELAAVVAAASRVVCGDTGVGHLATALRTPSVLLFGPVPPHEWGPPARRAYHRVLWKGMRGDPHAATPHGGLLRISVADVLEALDRLDATPAAAAA